MDNQSTQLINLDTYPVEIDEYGNNYIIAFSKKWFFSDQILKHIEPKERRKFINEITYENKLIVKDSNNYYILISNIKQRPITNIQINKNKDKNDINKNKNIEERSASILLDTKCIYVLEAEDHTVKIGVANNFCKRKRQIECNSGKRFINEFTTDLCLNAYNIENNLKRYFKKNNISGEWFQLNYNYVVNKVKEEFNKSAKI